MFEHHIILQIAASGVGLTVLRSPGGSQTITVSLNNPDKSATFTLPSRSLKLGMNDGKKTHMEVAQKKEFDRQVALLSEWLDQTEVMLELVGHDPSQAQDRLTVEEQLVLIEVKVIKCI